MAELQSLPFVHHQSFQVVYLMLSISALDPKFLRKRYPVIELLLLESLRVDPESLEMDE